MGVGAGLYMYMLSSYKSSRSLSHLLMSSCSLSLIVSELWRHQWRHNGRCGLHPRPWTT